MKKIMFVCHGNICRSPMAEYIFRDMAERAGRGKQFFVASTATSREEIRVNGGMPVYPPAKLELARHNIFCDEKRAMLLIKEDYDKFDLFIGMDEENIREMKRIFGGDPKKKIKKLLSYADREDDVEDPWYTGCFDIAYRDIYDGCAALFEKLTK